MRARAPENAAARFAESDDLPTPPLPLATASTRVPESTEIPGVRSLTPPRRRVGQRRLLLRRHDVEPELDLLDAVEREERLLDLLLEARAERAAGTVSAITTPTRPPSTADLAHHVELDHGAAQLGVVDALEGAQDLLLRGHET